MFGKFKTSATEYIQEIFFFSGDGAQRFNNAFLCKYASHFIRWTDRRTTNHETKEKLFVCICLICRSHTHTQNIYIKYDLKSSRRTVFHLIKFNSDLPLMKYYFLCKIVDKKNHAHFGSFLSKKQQIFPASVRKNTEKIPDRYL